MSVRNAINAARVLRELQERQVRDDDNLEHCAQTHPYFSDESDIDSLSPIMDRFIGELGTSCVKEFTSFTLPEFKAIYSHIEESIISGWSQGRGKRSQTAPKDAFFMMLTVFKTYATWEHHAMDFQMTVSTFEKLITKMMHVVAPILKMWIHRISKEELDECHQNFIHYPYAIYATDVKFQQCNRPMGSHGESKVYFSNKHKLYGNKIEMSVAPNS